MKKSYFQGHFWGYFGGDPESHFLVTFELLLIRRGFGGFRGVAFSLRTSSTTTRDRNLQFRGAVTPLEALHWIFCFFSSIYVQISKTSPLKSRKSSEKSSGENRVKSCHVCGCHGFFGPEFLNRKNESGGSLGEKLDDKLSGKMFWACSCFSSPKNPPNWSCQWPSRRDILMSREKECRETIFVSQSSRNYPHRVGNLERGKNMPSLLSLVGERQMGGILGGTLGEGVFASQRLSRDSGETILVASHQDVSQGPLGCGWKLVKSACS